MIDRWDREKRLEETESDEHSDRNVSRMRETERKELGSTRPWVNGCRLQGSSGEVLCDSI